MNIALIFVLIWAIPAVIMWVAGFLAMYGKSDWPNVWVIIIICTVVSGLWPIVLIIAGMMYLISIMLRL